MSVQFATIPLAHHYPDLPGLVRQIEDWGFEMVGVPDAHWLWPDCYVTLTQCALNSQRLRMGTFVTNPLTRHPAVTARSHCLDQRAVGRSRFPRHWDGGQRRV